MTSVTVDGDRPRHAADGLGRKLIVTPATVLADDANVRLRVTWTAVPNAVHRLGEEVPLAGPGESQAEGARAVGRGFLSDGKGGFFLVSQPNGAHTLFPSNDHPTDKAPFRVRLTAPAGMLGVATGDRVTQTANEDGTTTTTWDSVDPVATHVLGMGVGRWSILEADPAEGPHLRSSVPAGLELLAPLRTGALTDAVAWLEDALGRAVPVPDTGRAAGRTGLDRCHPRGPDAHPGGRRDARSARPRLCAGGAWSSTRWPTNGSVTRCRWSAGTRSG